MACISAIYQAVVTFLSKKHHTNTVSVIKLLLSENSLRKKNIDYIFAKSFINDMFEVCKSFGPNAVLFMSNGDETRILLGLAAAPTSKYHC